MTWDLVVGELTTDPHVEFVVDDLPVHPENTDSAAVKGLVK